MNDTMQNPDELEFEADGITVERVGSEILGRRYGQGDVSTDVYNITTREPDTGIEHTRKVNSVRIGCPECKANSKAIVHRGEYVCGCGYRNDCSTDKLLYDGLEQRETWEPY